MTSKSRPEFADLHISLLELEREEERKRQRKVIQESTLRLMVVATHFQKEIRVLTLQHESGRRLPKHSIEQGSQVYVSHDSICDTNDRKSMVSTPRAVVTEVTPVNITLGLTEVTPVNTILGRSHQAITEERRRRRIQEGDMVFIQPVENADHDRLTSAMEWLKRVKTDETDHSNHYAVPLVREMFKEHRQESTASGPDVPPSTEASSVSFINGGLNTSQREAVELALRDRPLAIIHGPPGTGKTTTVVEVILQHVKREQRVLVCAPSNKAVDNLVEGVWKQTEKLECGLSMEDVIRLGQLARIDEEHRQFSPKQQLEKRIEKCLAMRNLRMLAAQEKEPIELDELEEQFEEMDEAYHEADLMKKARVVLSTLTSAHLYTESMIQEPFDLLVIDECAQATEPACWLAIPYARKVLLAGDHCQLPPTILSQEAAQRGLAVSLMERQTELHGEGVVHMLDTQYRMNELIQAWSSRLLYGGRLKAAPEVGRRVLTDLPGVRRTKRTQPTLLLVDTAGCNLKETQEDKSSSYCNSGEANLVVCHAKSLVKDGLPAKDIGVITPYKQQVSLIERKMRGAGLDVEVNSVDGYQGREKEAVLLSLVRSNERRQVGFVNNRRRLNVAVTRARRHLFVVCDSATVRRDFTIRSLLDHIERSGEVRSAFCDQCPRGKEGYAADDDVDAGSDDGSAAAGGTDEWPGLASSLGAMNLK